MRKSSLLLMFLSTLLLVGASPAFSQSLLNQNKDDLLNGFNVDPNYLNQYPAKPQTPGIAGTFLKLIGAAIPQVNVNTASGDPSVKVKAPFVNVCVGKGLKVHAPFVHLAMGNPEPDADPPAPGQTPQGLNGQQAQPNEFKAPEPSLDPSSLLQKPNP